MRIYAESMRRGTQTIPQDDEALKLMNVYGSHNNDACSRKDSYGFEACNHTSSQGFQYDKVYKALAFKCARIYKSELA